MEDALVLVAHDVSQREPTLGVVHGAEHLAGLVQREGDMVRVDPDPGSVDPDLLSLGIDAGAELGDQFTVDLHASIQDDLLAFAS